MYRAYLNQIGKLEEDLEEFEAVLALAAQRVAQAAQRVAPVINLHCREVLDGSRTSQRVAHLLQRVAPLSTAQNCCVFTSFSLSPSQSLLHALECTMRVKGGNLGLYRAHLKTFTYQTHFLMFSFDTFITLILVSFLS